MLVYNIIIGIVFLISGFDSRWYNAHLLFSLGMYIADYNEQVRKFLTGKRWWVKFVGRLISFWVCSILFMLYKGALWSNIFRVLAGVFMCFPVIEHCKLNSKMLQWVAKNSLLIY